MKLKTSENRFDIDNKYISIEPVCKYLGILIDSNFPLYLIYRCWNRDSLNNVVFFQNLGIMPRVTSLLIIIKRT